MINNTPIDVATPNALPPTPEPDMMLTSSPNPLQNITLQHPRVAIPTQHIIFF